MERSSPLSGATPPRQGTHVLVARSDIVEVILTLVRETLRTLHCQPFLPSRDRKMGSSSEWSAKKVTRRRILGCLGYPMQTTFIFPVVLLGALAVLVAGGAIYQAIGTRRDRQRFPAPGRLVRVNERRMHIHVTGEGTPAVVFESGLGASCLSWTLVQPQVAQFTRAVSYDRAGHGWSDPAHGPRTAQQIAQELHALLDATGVPGPYVLVGHSVDM